MSTFKSSGRGDGEGSTNCPRCGAAVGVVEALNHTVHFCVKCPWTDPDLDRIPTLGRNMVKNERRKRQMQAERARSNRNTLRSYRIK